MGIGHEKFQNNNFGFKVSVSKTDFENNIFLIGCGATAHIICDREMAINGNFDSKNHIIELVDWFRQRNIFIAWGDAKISFCDSTHFNHI